MNERITAAAGALTAVMVGATAIARTWPNQGRHRAPAPALRDVLDEATLDELLGDWPEPVHGAAVAQAWADCGHCRKATAGVVADGAWWCGECFTTVPAGVS